jgi:uncharacterized protein involved in exopolysaccharide biosynthesis
MADLEADGAQGLPDWLRDPAGILRRRWRVMLGALLVGLVATAVVAWRRMPTYLAEATVLLATQQVDEALVKPTTPGNPIEALDALTAQALSPVNLKTVIETLNLYPDLRTGMSMGDVIATMRESIHVDAKQNTTRSMPFPMRGERSRVLVVGFEADDANTAASVANQLAHLFQAEGLRMRGEQSRLATEFMRNAAADAEKAIREQKQKIAEFESAHRGELPSDVETNQRRIERLQDQRNALLMSAAEAETRAATTSVSPSTADSPASRLAALKAALAKELAVNRESHPNVIALQRQVDAAQAEVRSGGGGGGGGAVAGASRREIAEYRAQIAAADQELAELDAKIANTPKHEAELVGLQQRAKVLEDSYDDLLGKLKEAELAQNLEQAQQGAQVAVLEEAQPPLGPEKGRFKLALAGVIASFGLAVAFGLALEVRDPVLATAQGVEAIAGVPVLGVIPKVS